MLRSQNRTHSTIDSISLFWCFTVVRLLLSIAAELVIGDCYWRRKTPDQRRLSCRVTGAGRWTDHGKVEKNTKSQMDQQ